MKPRLSHIMLVEDEDDIRELAKLSLSELGGFAVTTCSSGQYALDMVPQLKPQLIILDVMMPGMNGMEVMTKLREMPEGKEIPVIFMTARVQSDNLRTYKEMGALGTIAKPFDAPALPGNVQSLWDQFIAARQ